MQSNKGVSLYEQVAKKDHKGTGYLLVVLIIVVIPSTAKSAHVRSVGTTQQANKLRILPSKSSKKDGMKRQRQTNQNNARNHDDIEYT